MSQNQNNDFNNNINNFSNKERISENDQYNGIIDKTGGPIRIKNSNNNIGYRSNNEDNTYSKSPFGNTTNYFFQKSKIINSRIKSYNVYFIGNWFEKNQIPHQNYTFLMVNNIEFQSNTIIDQMRVLLDNIGYFKLQFLQEKIVNII